MSRVNKTNTRADHWKVSDIELYSNGMPVIRRQRVVKTIEYSTTVCPECEDANGENAVPAWIDDVGDAICPECGMVCGSHQVVAFPEQGQLNTSAV